MRKNLHSLLEKWRKDARSERDKGTLFEELCRVYLEQDPQMKNQFSKVWTFADWAGERDLPRGDVGIDLVAKIRDKESFCAVQCKFRREDCSIQRHDIDSFIAASSRKEFSRRMVIDSTRTAWGKNAEAILPDLAPPITRRSLSELEESPVDWEHWLKTGKVKVAGPKALRPHQKEALQKVQEGLARAERGKLIMACGTGKTLTGLRIAENLAGNGSLVLLMVPSLALMSQTVREWNQDAKLGLRCFAVCSDSQVGKPKVKSDLADKAAHDLAYAATTDAAKLAGQVGSVKSDSMTVIFATYHSAKVIRQAQQEYGLPEFNLVICDEAHRTTGATLSNEDESSFVMVHKNEHIRAGRRLYMTATPRIYAEAARQKAERHQAELASMDDPEIYGETLFQYGFSKAVEDRCLTDYKVIVLAVDEGLISRSTQESMAGSSEIRLEDASKIIGCWRALSKQDLGEKDSGSMKRVVSFCGTIKASKLITEQFQGVVDEYLVSTYATDAEKTAAGTTKSLACEVRHVDGTRPVRERDAQLNWLREEVPDGECRIISNVRCLSEGVDVPSLDAIMFLHPRKSQIDVVQSVGRVMRLADDKKLGYVILPVAVPPGVSAEEALNDNERYRVIWQVLNALRSHDESLEATVNQIKLGENASDRIQVIGIGRDVSQSENTDEEDVQNPVQITLGLDEICTAILAKIVERCGERAYWEDWAADIAKIAQNHITRIEGLLSKPDVRTVFDKFLNALKGQLNDSITEAEVVEMLGQHLVTRPVFDALFEGHFTQENPVSQSMQEVIKKLDKANIKNESDNLEKFYDSVRKRVSKTTNKPDSLEESYDSVRKRVFTITTVEAKQELVRELYDSFFRKAFPHVTERLGTVYTPVEVVDFILNSVNDLLASEFGQTLGSKGVHILDPFTGTGTFVTRLLESGLIGPEELEHKYHQEIHANEIVLLAYYIAAINIEAVWQGVTDKKTYQPFPGMCLSDTFSIHETGDLTSHPRMQANSERIKKQKGQGITVIVGNPPYSAKQRSANDNAANIPYPDLDDTIHKTYAAGSKAVNKNPLYDSYIRAIRWASDRIEKKGIIGFVTNASWLDGSAMDGMRKCLAEDFSSLYIFHLRGNQRTSGDLSKREGGKIFGGGSRAPIAVSLLVKNPDAAEKCRIFYHDIGDYLSREEKLSIIRDFKSTEGIAKANAWTRIVPDKHGDWLDQRDSGFGSYLLLGSRKHTEELFLFDIYSMGVGTSRDAWCYNPSKTHLRANIARTITAYNTEVELRQTSDIQDPEQDSINTDPRQISWSSSLESDLKRGRFINQDDGMAIQSLYRPFAKQWLHYSHRLNHRVSRMPEVFPEPGLENRVIAITGIGAGAGFSCLIADTIPDLNIMAAGAQCFPLHRYTRLEDQLSGSRDMIRSTPPPLQNSSKNQELISTSGQKYLRQSAISGQAMERIRNVYADPDITEEDVFYYLYGLLHSEDYRSRFAANLSKELPRLPLMPDLPGFQAFRDAGLALARLHTGFEQAEPWQAPGQGELYPAEINDPESHFRVTKMRFGGRGREKDKSVIRYNERITLTGIPPAAYEYVVNGRSAVEWVMDRQMVKTDKASGIVKDANLYATETVGDPKYPLLLLQRVITVSLETMQIVRSLPKLDFDRLL